MIKIGVTVVIYKIKYVIHILGELERIIIHPK